MGCRSTRLTDDCGCLLPYAPLITTREFFTLSLLVNFRVMSVEVLCDKEEWSIEAGEGVSHTGTIFSHHRLKTLCPSPAFTRPFVQQQLADSLPLPSPQYAYSLLLKFNKLTHRAWVQKTYQSPFPLLSVINYRHCLQKMFWYISLWILRYPKWTLVHPQQTVVNVLFSLCSTHEVLKDFLPLVTLRLIISISVRSF